MRPPRRPFFRRQKGVDWLVFRRQIVRGRFCYSIGFVGQVLVELRRARRYGGNFFMRKVGRKARQRPLRSCLPQERKESGAWPPHSKKQGIEGPGVALVGGSSTLTMTAGKRDGGLAQKIEETFRDDASSAATGATPNHDRVAAGRCVYLPHRDRRNLQPPSRSRPLRQAAKLLVRLDLGSWSVSVLAPTVLPDVFQVVANRA